MTFKFIFLIIKIQLEERTGKMQQEIKELQGQLITLLDEENALTQSEQFKAFMARKKALDTQMSQIKEELKMLMPKYGVKKLLSPEEYGVKAGEKWSITCSIRETVRVTDPNNIPDEYTRLEKVEEDFVVVDDELYRRVPDATKFKTHAQTGLVDKELPGIKVQESVAISFKVDGKTVKVD